MAPAPTKPVARKRNRKRKRRAVSLSSSSDSSSSDEDDISPASRPSPAKKSVELSESESSDSDSSSDSSAIPSPHSLATRQTALPDRAQQYQAPSRQRLHSPPPPVTAIPSFIPSTGSAENDAKEEQALRDKFRMFWMSSVADGFKDDLEEIRKVDSKVIFFLSFLTRYPRFRRQT